MDYGAGKADIDMETHTVINHIAPKLLKQITSLEETSAALRIAPQK